MLRLRNKNATHDPARNLIVASAASEAGHAHKSNDPRLLHCRDNVGCHVRKDRIRLATGCSQGACSRINAIESLEPVPKRGRHQ